MNLTAQRLRALRKREGLSQTEVARILGITRTAYNKYESGASAPSRKLRELAQLYHVSTDYILGEEDALAEKLREAGFADMPREAYRRESVAQAILESLGRGNSACR